MSNFILVRDSINHKRYYVRRNEHLSIVSTDDPGRASIFKSEAQVKGLAYSLNSQLDSGDTPWTVIQIDKENKDEY